MVVVCGSTADIYGEHTTEQLIDLGYYDSDPERESDPWKDPEVAELQKKMATYEAGEA